MESESLYDLVVKSQAGDQKALVDVLSKFYPVINYYKKQVKRHDQDDLGQEILMKLMKKILQYDVEKVQVPVLREDGEREFEMVRKKA